MAEIRGGQKLKNELVKLRAKLTKNKTLKVGFMADAKYPDGTSVAMVAAIQDFGAPKAGIPPRPFFRNMVKAKQGEWPGALARELKANGNDITKALHALGEGIVGQLQQSIKETSSPPLKLATIARKGSSKPLIDTGDLFRSVTHRVE